MKLINKFLKKTNHLLSDLNNIGVNCKIDSSVYTIGSTIEDNIEIGRDCKIVKSHLQGKIKIGKFTTLWGPNIFLSGKIKGIRIGNFCSIARDVSIQEDYHNANRTTTYFLEKNLFQIPKKSNAEVSKGPVIIQNDVWIGAGAQILSGITIGNGAIIAAGAIVTKDVLPYSIVGGNPAKIIRYRFNQEKIKMLEELCWWDWPIDMMQKNKDFLLSDADFKLIKNK